MSYNKQRAAEREALYRSIHHPEPTVYVHAYGKPGCETFVRAPAVQQRVTPVAQPFRLFDGFKF